MRPASRSCGFVLFVVLIFMILTTLLSMVSVHRTVLQMRIAGGEQERQLAFEAAELALRDAEHDLFGLDDQGRECGPEHRAPCRPEADGRWRHSPNHHTLVSARARFDTACTHGQCRDAPAPHGDAADMNWVAYQNRVAYGTYTGADTAWRVRRSGSSPDANATDDPSNWLRRPAYAIEYLGPFDGGDGLAQPYFRITAWAWDSAADPLADTPPRPTVVLQTVFCAGPPASAGSDEPVRHAFAQMHRADSNMVSPICTNVGRQSWREISTR